MGGTNVAEIGTDAAGGDRPAMLGIGWLTVEVEVVRCIDRRVGVGGTLLVTLLTFSPEAMTEGKRGIVIENRPE